MVNEYQTKRFCKDDISLIENYDKAIADKSQVWHCHHRRETIYSRLELKEIDEYYNRPACELIFLTPNEHHRLHNLGKNVSAETRQKLSEANKGQIPWNKGKQGLQHMSIEARKKMSEVHNGKPSWIKGKHHSAETRKKISEANKGKYWYNNGVKSIRAKTCPDGFIPGRIK